MKQLLHLIVFAASLLVSGGTLRSEIMAFSYAGGVVWASGSSGDLFYASGNEPPRVVWTGAEGISTVALAGSRLVLSADGKLVVFSLGSWIPRVTLASEGGVTALAGTAETALAIDGGGDVLKLEKDGSWSRRPKAIKGRVEALSSFRGLWIAVGWSEPEPTVTENEEEDGPANYGSPFWVRDRLDRKIWWSGDGMTWQAVDVPLDDMSAPYGMVKSVAGGPAGWLAVGTEGEAWFSAEGKTWKRIDAPRPEWGQYGETRVQCIGGAYWLTVSEGGARPDSLHRSTDGLTWETLPLAAGASRQALFIKDGKVHAVGVRKEGRELELAAVEEFGVVPQPNASELAAIRAAEAKALAEKQAAEEKALALKQAVERKRQAIAGNLADLSGVFHGTANGIAWDGDQLLVSAHGGIYRSTDGGKFELWIPYERIAFQGLREVGGRLWTWQASPSEARSMLASFPLNPNGKLPVSQTAAGRITGLAGDGSKLALITEGGLWSGVYTLDDPAKGWSFKMIEIPGLLPMKLSGLPGNLGPDLAFGNGRWVAIGRGADDTTVAAVSTDRVNWKVGPVGGPKAGMMRIVFANGRFVATGHQAFSKDTPWTVASSADGETWQLATLPGERPGLVDVAGGRLYAHNRTSLYTSDDARTWRYVADHAPLDAVTLQEIAGRIVLVGEPVTEGRANAPQFQLVQLPVPSAAALAAAPDVATRNAVAALARFDEAALTASSPEQLGRPAAALVSELDRLMPGKLADAVFAAAKHVLFHVGGAYGYYGFMMGLPEGARLKAASAQLRTASQPQQDIIKALSTQELNRIYNRPTQAVDIRVWPAKSVPARQAKKSEGWDLAVVRQALAAGAYGAAMDLQIAYAEGQSVPVDPMLAVFWSTVAEALIPDSQAKDDAKAYRAAAAGGSAFARVWLAQTLEQEDAAKHRQEIIALLTQAKEGGFTYAAKMLAALGAEAKGGATAGDWFGAATNASAMQAQLEADRLRKGQPGSAQPSAKELASQAKEAANSLRDAAIQSGHVMEPGRAAADLANARSIGLLGAMVRLLALEQDEKPTAEEIAQLKRFWAEAAAGRIDRSTLDKEIGAQNFLSEKVEGFFDDPAVAAQVLAAHRRMASLPDVPPDLPAQIAGLEEWLAGFARRARQAGNLLVMPAIYHAATERVYFDRYQPLLQLPIGVRPYGNPSLASQLKESAYLMEDFNGADWDGGNGPPLSLAAPLFGPDSAPLYISWIHWPALKKAAGAGNVPDVIFYVNQLLIALRIELAARQPDAIQPPAKAFSDLLADAVRP